MNGKSYVEILTASGRLYSLTSFEDPTANWTEPASIDPSDLSEFFVAGAVPSTRSDRESRIVSARYTNPCGTTSRPWLGNCVDIGDTLPGNGCMACEMEGGFAQFLPIANGMVCGNDGRYCNGAEECNAGLCLPSGNPCTYPQLCMERDEECVEPIPIGQAMPDDAVPTTLTAKTSVTPDVNEMMLREWINHAKAEAEGEAFDPAWDDTDWSLLDLDAEPTTSATSASVHRETNDEDTGGCGM
ncbi:MAG: hypothetical protein IT350_14800 [Deltaproteobacteria bacterium]|nr:hypothetical protein [Deltaproteobacteria bacterium]